ncbi:MAG: hypothetical protein CMJ38_07270 [Phycisphaerae bacterium]|nr:hypothetical protein [Phycisphaerae bacterium]
MASKLTRERFGLMAFAEIYPHYVNKVKKKGKSVEELHQVLSWLTGYSEKEWLSIVENKVTYNELIDNAKFHEISNMIKGVVCPYRVEDIEDDFERKLRYMDKLVDELTRGKKMKSILRK